MTIRVHDEGDNHTTQAGHSSSGRHLEQVSETDVGHIPEGNPNGTVVDQPSVDDSRRIDNSKVSSAVPDNASGRRKQWGGSDNNVSVRHAVPGELSRSLIPEKREHQRHQDSGEQQQQYTDARERYGSSDVRKDQRIVEHRKHDFLKEFEAVRVEPEHVENWWPLVQTGIEYTVRKTGAPFKAEDVKQYCQRNLAWLLIAYTKDGTYAGCVVIAQSALDNFATKPELLIWVAYSKTPGAAESVLKKVEVIAKKLGFGYIVFHSPRDGWLRRAKDLGFTLRERVYEKKIG